MRSSVGPDVGTRDDATELATAVRRVVVGFRVVATLWLGLLGVVAIAGGAAPAAVVIGTLLAAGWTGVTLAVARAPVRLSAWWWLLADTAVAAAVIAVPVAVDPSLPALYGGYPFSAVAFAATMHGSVAGLGSAGVLAAATIARLAATGALDPQGVVETVVFYLASGALLGWADRTLRRNDAQRRAAESALAAERAERIRSAERAETAAHLHDSVLQTLALIQRRSGDGAAVSSLARRQERELRDWLGGERRDPPEGAAGLADALAGMCEAVEADHPIRVELVTVSDEAMDDDLAALVAATREAVTNTAKHGAVDVVSVYAEATPEAVTVFVRDRGVGFDPAAVPADRRGIAQSIVERMDRHGGSAAIRSVPGEATEVELRLPHATRMRSSEHD